MSDMWRESNEPNTFDFEILRPDYNGDLEVLQCSLSFSEEGVSITSPDKTIVLFENEDRVLPNRFEAEDQYLFAHYDEFFLQFKIEPHEGLIADVYNEEFDTEIMDTVAVWWEDF